MHLQRYADAVVDRVCRHRLGKMSRPPKIEIDFVASLVENGAPRLERLWRHALGRGVNVRVGGVFTHQSPLVVVQGRAPRPVTTNGCELADLLILHSHRTAAGKVFLRGVLMQTKIDKGGAFVPDDPSSGFTTTGRNSSLEAGALTGGSATSTATAVLAATASYAREGGWSRRLSAPWPQPLPEPSALAASSSTCSTT